MFFRKAKRIKYLEEYVDYYARSNSELRSQMHKALRAMAASTLDVQRELIDKEKMLIAGMLGSNITKLEFSQSDLKKADNCKLRHVTDPMFDKDWLEIKEYPPLP